jgi:D-alanyl-D-alanine carboxypeptidase
MESLVAENQIPGLNFSIIYPDGKQEDYSVGFADTLSKQKLTPGHTLFSGSIGKTYLVTLLMQLVEEGRVELSDPFVKYFPDTEWLQLLPNANDINIEMLLSHTSGLPRYVDEKGVWDTLQANPDKVWTYKERLSFIFNHKAVHAPGQAWAYSDCNYLLLGMLIEKLTGSDYYDEVRRRILEPEELRATYPAIKRNLPNLPVGYSRMPEFSRLNGIVVSDGKYAFNPQMEWTGGGFVSTTSDLARWAKLFYEHQLFSGEALKQITTPNRNGMDLGNGQQYGMGSFIYDTEIGKAYGHTGFAPGFRSVFAYYPKQKIAVALQLNSDYLGEKMSLIQYLDRILHGIKV